MRSFLLKMQLPGQIFSMAFEHDCFSQEALSARKVSHSQTFLLDSPRNLTFSI